MQTLLTVNDLMQRLTVSRPTIYRWIQSGVIPKPVKFGNSQNSAARWVEADLIAALRKIGVSA